MMNKAVIAIVDTQAEAEALLARLQAAGFGTKDMSVLLPDTKGSGTFAYEHHTKAPEGATAGVGLGGIVVNASELRENVPATSSPRSRLSRLRPTMSAPR
jgi:hypothetical protein